MTNVMRLATVGADCVACGCCVLVCPRGAIQISRGIRAEVNQSCCVGCGLCAKACPAAVIAIKERGESA